MVNPLVTRKAKKGTTAVERSPAKAAKKVVRTKNATSVPDPNSKLNRRLTMSAYDCKLGRKRKYKTDGQAKDKRREQQRIYTQKKRAKEREAKMRKESIPECEGKSVVESVVAASLTTLEESMNPTTEPPKTDEDKTVGDCGGEPQ